MDVFAADPVGLLLDAQHYKVALRCPGSGLLPSSVASRCNQEEGCASCRLRLILSKFRVFHGCSPIYLLWGWAGLEWRTRRPASTASARTAVMAHRSASPPRKLTLRAMLPMCHVWHFR